MGNDISYLVQSVEGGGSGQYSVSDLREFDRTSENLTHPALYAADFTIEFVTVLALVYNSFDDRNKGS